MPDDFFFCCAARCAGRDLAVLGLYLPVAKQLVQLLVKSVAMVATATGARPAVRGAATVCVVLYLVIMPGWLLLQASERAAERRARGERARRHARRCFPRARLGMVVEFAPLIPTRALSAAMCVCVCVCARTRR